MKITDLLKRESVELSGTPESKGQAIDQMVELMAKGGNINDLQRYKEGVLKREGEGTTGIGEGIAIPHAKTDAVSAPGLAAMLVPQGVDYDAPVSYTHLDVYKRQDPAWFRDMWNTENLPLCAMAESMRWHLLPLLKSRL